MGFTIYITDAQSIRYCAKGMRLFCKRYGFDYIDFVKNGVDSDLLLSTGDAMAKSVVEKAKEPREIK